MRLWSAFLLVAMAGTLASCGDRFPDYHYKMTINVDTPEGEKSFSSVRQVRMVERKTIQDSTGKPIDRELTGEAVVLDLPSGPVFALLAMPNDGQTLGVDYGKKVAEAALLPYVSQATLDRWRHGRDTPGDPIADDAAVFQEMVEVKGRKDLPRTRPNPDIYKRDEPQPLWPLFVAFRDINDPKSVYHVSPETIGVKRITVEITQEDVSNQIRHRLPWLESQRGALVPPNPHVAAATQPLSTRIAEDAFRQGS